MATAITLLVSAVLPPPAQAQQCTVPTAYWPMDGDGTEIINGFPGTPVGSASFAPGFVGQALELDGEADGSTTPFGNPGGPYLDAGTHPELTAFGGNELTIAAWVRREADGSAGNNPAVDPFLGLDGAIVSARTQCGFPPPPAEAGLGNYQLYGSLGENLYFSKWGPRTDPADGFSKPETAFFTGVQAPLGIWTHVAVSYDGTSARFYVNGTLAQESPASGPAGTISDEIKNLQIGWDSCEGFWTGGIDELAIWSSTLTDAQVQDVYLTGVTGQNLCTDDQLSVADQIAVLADKVDALAASGDLQRPIALQLALRGAAHSVKRGKDRIARVQLRIFIALTKYWERRGRISSANADDLIADARAIIYQL